MKIIPMVVMTILILSSCTVNPPKKQQTTQSFLMLPHATSEPVLMPPKIKAINWHASFSPIAKQILSINSINDGSLLLVNNIKNNTNGILQTITATSTLTYLVSGADSKFNVVSNNALNTARQTFGLSADDSLESRSKAIGLARYLNAQYLLYSIASGDVQQPDLDLQLILVRTGEIVWSGKSVAQRL